ncbi:MAG TPA: hypothetical protein VMT24_00575 [Aggregatilineaceae bacterium]|nr:hypothetical protein [Aggregatilineaceae bacterium]
MNRRCLVIIGSLLALTLILAACGESEPSETVIQGQELLSVTFDQPGSWEEGTYPTDAATPDSTLAISGGRYRIDLQAGQSASFTWGAGGGRYENAVIEVDAEQLSSEKNNLYGVACRLATDGQGETTGYVLLISGDGHYGIAELTNNALSFLLEWHQSGTIRQGRASNRIRAVCVDNTLAIYANGKFLGQVENADFRRAAQVGLVAGVTKGEAVSVAFDNLAVYEGTLSEK